jgi:hypothetical protein
MVSRLREWYLQSISNLHRKEGLQLFQRVTNIGVCLPKSSIGPWGLFPCGKCGWSVKLISPYVVSFLRVSGAIAPSPLPSYFCRGSRFSFPGGVCCDPSAIKLGYENTTTKVCLCQHDLSHKLLEYRYPTNTDNEFWCFADRASQYNLSNWPT